MSAGHPRSEPVVVSLGPFDLVRPIGRGGMAEVWLAVHQGTSTEVAIKVVSEDTTRHHRWLARFRNEIRAVAGLNHPGIVHVDDFGEIDAAAERLSQGRLRAGSPYLVMELVPGGSLRSLTGRFRWTRLRTVLLRLLDALAHAHARGLIHRDITPGNVLGDGRVVKLADFGLSHQVTATNQRTEVGVSGTPAYMAPEQWEGRWRDYGPWTDLYGVGCLAWALATGFPPFRGLGDIAELREQHLWEKLPPLRGRHTVPAGFERWLRGLLAKDPTRRFRRAADAAWALLDLPEDLEPRSAGDTFNDLETDPMMGAIGEFTTDPDLSGLADAVPTDRALPPVEHFLEQHWAVVLPDRRGVDVEDTLSGYESPAESPTGHTGAPIPRSWRGPPDVLRSRLLPGAGLRLYGFRTIPVVGRDDEKTALWDALVDVHASRHPRAVQLTGAAGCGKSRLASWLCERAHEVGGATVLRAGHGPIEGPTHGIGPALRRFLRLEGLDRDGTFARMRDVLRREGVNDLYEWAALTELVASKQGTKTASTVPIRIADPGERFLILRRFLRRLCEERPVVLWLDDAHWAAEDLRFVQHLLASGAGLPVLVVLTVRDDVVSARPLEFELLRGLETSPHWAVVPIGPLPPDEWRQLVRRILVLEGDLAAQVEERTAGNPLFAVQLVADWVQRGILEPGPVGFRLRRGMQAQLPDNLHQVWVERMDRILEGLPDSDRTAVQLAAVLGQEVDDGEWSDACSRAGVAPSVDLLERLQSERLVAQIERGGEVGWRFAHGMLRETNERMAAARGHLDHLHQICAEMLEDRSGPRVDERIGKHLLAANEYDAAIKPLLAGATHRREYGEFRHAELLLNERENALRALDIEEQDARWVEGWVLRATLEVERHRLDRAEVLASRAQAVAEQQQLRSLDGWASHVLGRIACLEGNLDRAFQHLGKAARLARRSSDRQLAAACHAGQGMAYFLEDKLDDAAEFCRRARREYAATGQTLGAASMSLQLSSIALRAGRDPEAAKHIADALAGFESLGARNSVALCITQRGAIERARGDRETAERSLREALGLYRELGTDGYLVPLVQLAVVLLEQWEHREARRLLEDAIEALERVGGWSSLGALQILLLPAVALDGDWEEFDRLLPEADVLITSTGIVHDDIPSMARQAAEIARHAHEPERAGRAYALALAQYHALGDLREVARTRAALHGLLAGQADEVAER